MFSWNRKKDVNYNPPDYVGSAEMYVRAYREDEGCAPIRVSIVRGSNEHSACFTEAEARQLKAQLAEAGI